MLNDIRFVFFFYHKIKDNDKNLCQDLLKDLLTIENTHLKVHALHYLYYLYASDFPFKNFRKLSQHTETIQKKCLGKEFWRVLVVDKSADHDKPHFDLFFTTISTSNNFFFQSARRARAEKGIARQIDAGSVVWLGPSNFWLVRSEYGHASYPGLSFRPPGFNPYMGQEERRVQGLDYGRTWSRQKTARDCFRWTQST